MAGLIELREAAKMLGVSPDELTDMRSRNEIFGYRDGATWKFKQSELERIAQERGIKLGEGGSTDESDGLVDVGDLSPDKDSGSESDSILVSDEELGQSDENTASTIIGEADDLVPSGESDLELEGGSELRLAGGARSGDAESDVELAVESSDVLGEPETEPGPSDTANLDSPSSSEIDDLSLASDSGSLELSLDDLNQDSELRLGDSRTASSSGFGSAIDLDLDDDELVLGSGSGSDVTLGAGDSGINLANPSDSGVSLEQQDELAAGGGELLELGEDEMIDVDEVAEGSDLQSDDDFLLTPDEEGVDDDADSGSQVIALDTEEFDDSAAQMLSEGEAPALEEETVEFTDVDESVAPGPMATATAVAADDTKEVPYSIWNVLSLLFVVVLLSFTGILMLDLMNNIWSWQGNYSFNSKIMDAILAMLPGSS